MADESMDDFRESVQVILEKSGNLLDKIESDNKKRKARSEHELKLLKNGMPMT